MIPAVVSGRAKMLFLLRVRCMGFMCTLLCLQMMVASAEEAVGLTELLYKFNALPTNPKVKHLFK